MSRVVDEQKYKVINDFEISLQPNIGFFSSVSVKKYGEKFPSKIVFEVDDIVYVSEGYISIDNDRPALKSINIAKSNFSEQAWYSYHDDFPGDNPISFAIDNNLERIK